MGMANTSLDLRRRIVTAYRSGKTSTYETTAEMFGVGRATVDRLLRRFRETGDVLALPVGGNNPRRVDLAWLEQHARVNPDVRLKDRVAAWQAQSGRRVSIAAMWGALHAIGWTHKKRHWSPANGTGRTSRRSGGDLPPLSLISTLGG